MLGRDVDEEGEEDVLRLMGRDLEDLWEQVN